MARFDIEAQFVGLPDGQVERATEVTRRLRLFLSAMTAERRRWDMLADRVKKMDGMCRGVWFGEARARCKAVRNRCIVLMKRSHDRMVLIRDRAHDLEGLI